MMQMLKILEENQLQLRNDNQRIGSLDRTMLVKADKDEVRACLLKEQFQKFAEQNNTILRSKAALTITDALQHRAQVSVPPFSMLSGAHRFHLYSAFGR